MRIEDLNKQKGYVIVTKYFEQYALGVTGCHRIETIITDNGKPFPFKKDAINFAKINNIKKKSKKGSPSEGYGSLGAMSFDVYYVKADELGDAQRYYIIK